jgi:CRP-like cAMP-binding protein
MLNQIIYKLKEKKDSWDRYQHLFQEIKVPSKTTLIKEGQVSENIYFVKEGCLRLWFNKDGKDITFQFFFENQVVSSLLGREPSLFTLESIEHSTIISFQIKYYKTLLEEIPELKNEFIEIILQRLDNYAKLFLSQIKDNPQERYAELVKKNPQLLQRIPQHYIASYLGITTVSLSRIRNRK